MKKVKHNGVTIDYDIAGQGDSTLLFVHGSYIDQTYWDEQILYFSSTHQVVTMDLAGHGDSGKNRNTWTIREFGNDVVTLIKELDLKNVILVGHSMGGDVNLEAAVAYPDPIIGFIGVDTFKNAASPLPEQYQDQVETIKQQLQTDFENTNEQYARMALLTPRTSTDIAERVVNDYRNAYKPMGIQTMADVFGYYQREKELLPQLKAKLYLINVDYQPTNEDPLKQYAGAGYEVIHMEGTSHFPMIENPDKFNSLLEDTIHKIEKETAN